MDDYNTLLQLIFIWSFTASMINIKRKQISVLNKIVFTACFP